MAILPTIQFNGVSSGLDTKSIISALMQPVQQPLTNLQTAATNLNARQTALTTLSTSLNDLLAKVQAFTLTSAGAARSAASSDPTSFTAVANSAAVPGQHTVTVDRLATATVATSTAALGTAVTDATATNVMSSLPLSGTVTAGQVGLVVDGSIVNVTVGNPATTSLKSVMDAIAGAIQSSVQATDPGATVTSSVVNNKMQFSISGAGGSHEVRFGVGGDTSNALTLFGLAGQDVTGFGAGTTTITGAALLGVTQAGGPLDSAGITGLTSTTTGTITINGVAISYNSAVDSLSTVLARINNSQAGVVASIDRTNDRVVLTGKGAGPTAISIADTSGTLGAALKLAPGTTNAQVVGQSAQATVDGKTVTSNTNTITSAVDGVTMTLTHLTSSPATLTVGVDTAAIEKSMGDLVTSYNSLANTIDQLTTHAQGAPPAPLEGDSQVEQLAFNIRSMFMSPVAGLTGSITSLGDLGVNSGAIGSKVGSTTRLQLDTSKLDAALAGDPTRVASLLSATGGILGPIQDRIKAVTWSGGLIDNETKSITDQLRENAVDQSNVQSRIDARQAALEAKFATLEATLATLQSQGAAMNSQIAAFNSGLNSGTGSTPKLA
jgi:flagellar hook-associated protein 2